MPTSRSNKLAWMTYLIAGAAGWGIVALLHGDHGSPQAQVTASSRTQREASAIPSGSEILARIEKESKATEGAAEHNLTDNLRAMIAKRLEEMPPSRDPGAEAIAAIGRLGDMKLMSGDTILLEENLGKRIEIAALFHRWMEQDPQAALDHADSLPEDSMAYIASGAGYGIEYWGENVDPAKLQELVLARPDKVTSVFLSKVLGSSMGKAGDFAAFAKAYGEMGANRPGFSDGVGKNWPAERATELVDFAVEHQDLTLLGDSLQRMKAEDAVAWFDKAVETDGKGMLINKLAMSYGHRLADEHREELGLEATIVLMERLNKLSNTNPRANPREAAVKSVVFADVGKTMIDPGFRDVLQSFSEGKTDALAVLDAVNAAGPELAAYPDLVRDQVYSTLVGRSPAAALKLLEGLPEAERYQKVNAMAYYAIGTTPDPRRVFELFDAAPYKPELGPEAPRAMAWLRTSSMSYSIYGDDYLAWLKRQPAGATRDIAIKAMAQQLEKTEPAKAAELRAAQATQK